MLAVCVEPDDLLGLGNVVVEPGRTGASLVWGEVRALLDRAGFDFACRQADWVFVAPMGGTDFEAESGRMRKLMAPSLAPKRTRLLEQWIGELTEGCLDDMQAAELADARAVLAEEIASEKMRYTLDLKEKRVKETALEGEANKVRSEKAAEAAAQAPAGDDERPEALLLPKLITSNPSECRPRPLPSLTVRKELYETNGVNQR